MRHVYVQLSSTSFIPPEQQLRVVFALQVLVDEVRQELF